MKKVLQAFIGVLVLMTGLVPVLAFARDNEGGSANVQTTVRVSTDSGEDDSEVRDNASGQAETDREHSSTTKRYEGDRESLHTNGSNDDEDSEIEIDQDSATEASSTIEDPEEVSNRGELRSFLNHALKTDEHIGDVHVSSTTVETHYDVPAKFLWSIPMDLTANVVVNADHSVTVTYPWYAFLFATQSGLEDKLNNAVSASSTIVSDTLSANAQAHLLNLLFSVLRGTQN